MKINKGSTKNRRRRGNAFVEAALAAPMLFLLLSGVIDFGRAFYFADIAAGAARAGAQYGILSSANVGNIAGMQAAAREEAAGVPSSMFTVTAEFYCQNSAGVRQADCSDSTWEEYVSVKTNITYALMMPWPGLANPLNIGGISVIRVQ